MLNTDAHNPAIPVDRKMKRDQFIWNLRGINSGKDLDAAYLEKLYDNIKNKPLELEYERDEFVQW
jgi:Sec7-like guanine-nucleotide exchange factor